MITWLDGFRCEPDKLAMAKVLDLVRPNGAGGGRCGLVELAVGQVFDLMNGKGLSIGPLEASPRGGPSRSIKRGEAFVGIAAIGLPSESARRDVAEGGMTGVAVTCFSLVSLDNLSASDCIGLGLGVDVDDDGWGGCEGDEGGRGGGAVQGGGGGTSVGAGPGATMVHLFKRSAPSPSPKILLWYTIFPGTSTHFTSHPAYPSPPWNFVRASIASSIHSFLMTTLLYLASAPPGW